MRPEVGLYSCSFQEQSELLGVVQLLFYLCSAKCRGSMMGMGKHIPSGVE